MLDTNESFLPIITGSRVILRMPVNHDIDAIISFYIDNKEFLAPYEPVRHSSFYTREYWESDIKSRSEDYNNDRALRMFIFEKSDPTKVIGVVNFNQIVRGVFHASFLGYNLAEHKQGTGLMSESLGIAIEYAFNHLNLHRIMANYMPHNQKSGNVLKRLGFTVEGYARDYLLINGKWEDHILTSITNPNWEVVQKKDK